jgi:hypothetical protein
MEHVKHAKIAQSSTGGEPSHGVAGLLALGPQRKLMLSQPIRIVKTSMKP